MDALTYLDSLIASHSIVGVQRCELEFLRKLVVPVHVPTPTVLLAEEQHHLEPQPEFYR